MPVYIGKSGDLVGWHRCLTHWQTTEDRATQLLCSIQLKLSHAIHHLMSHAQYTWSSFYTYFSWRSITWVEEVVQVQQRCVQIEDWLWHNGLGQPIFCEWWHICNNCFLRYLVYELLIWSQCVCTLHWYIFWVNLNIDIEHFVWSWRDKNRYISDFCVCVIMSLAPSSLSYSQF